MNRLGRVDHRPRNVAGLEYLGRHAHAKSIPLKEHVHEGVEICYLASGEVAWMLGRRRMRLVGGQISVMQPGVAHRGEMDAIAPSDLYWVIFRPARLRPSLDPATLDVLTAGRPFTAPAPLGCGELFDELIDECKAGRPGGGTAAAALLALLAVKCARTAMSKGTDAGRQLQGISPPATVATAARRLSEDIEDPPRIRDLARELGLGPTRFHALFKEHIGLTPADYLRRARLAHARSALAETAEDITSLAIRLGFPSSQYFATAFRRYTGLTPTEYRRREKTRH